jgi:glycosyltransferase involved in cell wall biosynthesis
MRVLHFRSPFSKLSETFIYDMVCELDRKMGDQHVVALRRINEAERPFPRVRVLHVPRRWHPKAVWHRIHTRYSREGTDASQWALIRNMMEATIRDVSPAVVHAHFGSDGLAIAPVVARLGIPLVVSFHGVDASRLLDNDEIHGLMKREVFGIANIVAVSQEMKGRLVGKGARDDRIHVIHVGKRTEEYNFNPPVNVRRFVSVGRMIEKKGHFDTVRAFATICNEYKDVSLDIVGGGDLMDNLRDLIHGLNIENRVVLHGYLSHDQVKDVMARSDAFVLSSRRAQNGDCEGAPTVLMEAQAAGLPCVSTWHAGIPETIPAENHHLLAPEGDVEGIASRMRWLTQAPPDELVMIAERGRAHIEENYNLATEARKLMSLYEHIV